MSTVTLRMEPAEARAAHHALATVVQLMDEVGEIPPHAPLYGWRDRLAALARRLDHEINHAGHNPLGGAARGVGRCVCAAGPGTNPACEVHP
jgi:hypothetical protein